jgi:hypothetical protein
MRVITSLRNAVESFPEPAHFSTCSMNAASASRSCPVALSVTRSCFTQCRTSFTYRSTISPNRSASTSPDELRTSSSIRSSTSPRSVRNTASWSWNPPFSAGRCSHW